MKTKLLEPNEESLKQAGEIIRNGGLVAFPTETVYGLGADALSPEAVAWIFEAKERPKFDPVIVHVSSPEQAEGLWAEVPPLARKLMERFWPGPLTITLPKRSLVPDIVTAGRPTVAVRMPSHPVTLGLIRAAGRPIAAPSANRFGRMSPTHHEHVLEELGGRIEAVIATGRTPVGIESTVISLAEDPPRVLRPGGTPLELLREVVGELRADPPVVRSGPAPSPGTLRQHYMPRIPLFLVKFGPPEGNWIEIPRAQCGYLSFTGAKQGFKRVEVLSQRGDLREAAANLFAALRRLDSAGLSIIVAEPVPQVGLGVAIMDRLKRASQGMAHLSEHSVWIEHL